MDLLGQYARDTVSRIEGLVVGERVFRGGVRTIRLQPLGWCEPRRLDVGRWCRAEQVRVIAEPVAEEAA